jgi:hypothetical protein
VDFSFFKKQAINNMKNTSEQTTHKAAKKAIPVNQSTIQSSSLKIVSLLSIIAIITLVSFSNAFKNSYISWDDDGCVYQNNNLSKPLTEAATYYF